MYNIRESYESSAEGIPLYGNLNHVNGKLIGIAREVDHVRNTEYILVFVGDTLIARFNRNETPIYSQIEKRE